MTLADITAEEKRLSEVYSSKLGYPVTLFLDGRWICDPQNKSDAMGFGETPLKAVSDHMKART